MNSKSAEDKPGNFALLSADEAVARRLSLQEIS